MTTPKFLKRDIKLGIFNQFFLYIIPILFSIAAARDCHRIIEVIKSANYLWSDGTIMDYYVYAMKGMNYFRFSPRNKFLLPVLWFVFQIGISYFVAYYAEKDFTDNGKNVIIAGGSRTSWWLSKMLWCVLSVISYFIVTFVSCAIFSVAYGAELSLKITPDFLNYYFGYEMTFISYNDLLLITIVVPLVVSIGICLVQLLLSFVISPVTSFAFSCMLYVLSAFYTVWFLPGSYTMWLRSSYFIENGLNPLSGLLIAGFLVVTVFCLGKMYFDEKDII